MNLRHGLWLACMLGAIAPARAQSADCPAGPGHPITVTNLYQNEVVGYELLLIKGTLGVTADKVWLDPGTPSPLPQNAPPLESDATGLPKPVREWPAGGGRFKAMVHLKRGQNRIVLSAEGHARTCLDINYSPNPSYNRIRLVFVLARDGSEGPGVFQAAPDDYSDLSSAKRRLGFGALLLETAMAELLHDSGRPRRSVDFKRDGRGQVEVTVFHSSREDADLRLKTPDELYELFHGELDSAFQDGRTIFLSMLGGFGSGALGGSRQAMFGTSTLYSWAQGLDELTARFSDSRDPGDFQLVDESGFRNTFWGNYSTGIGATLHELGHALGLPHSGDGDDIMERGFDRFNRIFMIKEDGALITDEAVHYAKSSVDLLFQSPWVLPAAPAGLRERKPGAEKDARLTRSGNRISLRLPAAGKASVDLYAPDGSKAANLFSGDLAAGDHEFTLPPMVPGVYLCGLKREAADGAKAPGRTVGKTAAMIRIVIP
ncbi:MAG: hypothetical protein JWP91_2380 [Fibrobacteres bacterium]|nr:hypothetical protein [Fibrobacterota bacterium]